ncbi:serine/arginine repetitive matrix protein 1 [Brassica napus]|uniref:DUF4408 domain-containing protein n=2 Tax=Brassica oleracea TaxID=3712 RepID=A0A0D3DMB9_BRAOL|nr:PREDICTED: serine/arginine repetitive matrix protein 1-like [Brassica oleracea var. oleracea]XP_013708195.2 serine/arginine repetitive matrix protein 1 [Brassica napus]VDD55181.1 unnamed protein product [Brassica oleracea]
MVETTRSSKKTTQSGDKKDQNPRKFYSRFLFKALILALLCSLVPVFLSQTPELANQTRLLELLHMIFVGIAVSYGLFSRRNYEGGGESNNNTNNPHPYVPKILEVSSSVFNVDHHESGSDDSSLDNHHHHHRRIQTWRNKYQTKIPETVLSTSGVREKPLLLPVRSLNYSRGSDSGRWESVRSKRQLLKTLVDDNSSDALPSPIPWRSRSSSMEIESQPLIKTPANLTSSSSSSTPLPKLTSESGAEDTVRKKEFHPSPSPPPPPPPPPLPAFYNSAPRKDYPPPRSYRESVQKKNYTPPPPPPPPPPMDYYKSPPSKLRVSSERRKLSEQKMKLDERSATRNSPTKVWWSDPIAETKEDIREDMNRNDRRSFVGSKATEESEDKEDMITENVIHEDGEHSEKKIEEEINCGNISDVDKKADEFIAKFREQIRLQRIESIKRSACKISANSSR